MPLNGSEITSPPETCPQASLTSDPSSTSAPMTCGDMFNATSSPGSAAGRSPSKSPDGLTINPSGREAALASPEASPDDKAASTMSVTYGRFGENLSPSDALQRS